MAYKKIDIEFCFTDDSINCYNYQLLSKGFQLQKYNPQIGYLMHKRDNGVAVKWEDFRLVGDKWYAKPVVNEDRFPNLANEIEAGFYRGASVGKIVPLKWNKPKTKDATLVVTEWYCGEISIVDIPGNSNALAVLYDEKENVLMDLSNNKRDFKMETEKIDVSSFLFRLNLSSNCSQGQFDLALADMLAKAGRTDSAEKELKDLKATVNKEKMAAVLETAKKEGKITNEMSVQLEKDYGENVGALENLLKTLPAQKTIVSQLSDNKLSDLPDKYRGKSRSQLFNENLLPDLKREYPEHFAIIMKGETE